MLLIIGQGNKSGGGGGGASAADKALAQATTLDGRLYNLWEVLPKVKADPRASGYACIMLCEYYLGYNSLSLVGANAYITCDGDYYSGLETDESVNHLWHDTDSNFYNRWVAFLFATENPNYHINNTGSCPRRILIDGVFGNIYNSVASRLDALWMTDGSSCNSFYSTTANISHPFLEVTKIGTIRQQNSALYLSNYGRIFEIGIEKSNTTTMLRDNTCLATHISLPKLTTANNVFYAYATGYNNLIEIKCEELVSCNTLTRNDASNHNYMPILRRIICPKLVEVKDANGIIKQTSATSMANLVHIEIGQGFNSSTRMLCSFSNCLKTDTNDLVEDLTATPTWSNLDQWLYNFEHLIVDKLADLSGQTAKTITLAAAPYAAITEGIRAKMSAKNWNLASA